MIKESNQKALQSMSNAPKNVTPNTQAILSTLEGENTLKMVARTLGQQRAGAFIQACRTLIMMPESSKIRECTPVSVIGCCMACASTNLSITPAFGESAIVPFGNTATFMVMANGLMRLAQRSMKLKTINTTVVYEGDIKSFNPFTGVYEYNVDPHPRTEKVGHMAYVALTNGFEKYLYMTNEELVEHGKRYSQTFRKGYGLWETNFDAMARKTVLRQLILKYTDLAVHDNLHLANALNFDMSSPSTQDIEDAFPVYPDSPDAKPIETEHINLT